MGPKHHASVHVKRYVRLSGLQSGCGIALLKTKAENILQNAGGGFDSLTREFKVRRGRSERGSRVLSRPEQVSD